MNRDGAGVAIAAVAALAAVAAFKRKGQGQDRTTERSSWASLSSGEREYRLTGSTARVRSDLGGLHAMMDQARVEKDVENAYRAAITAATGAKWSSPYGTDGIAEWGDVRLLLEVKYDLDFKSRPVLCGVLGQAILYLKKIENAGDVLPNVLMVGDRNEWFVLPVSAVQAFLSLPIDWSVSPSGGCTSLTSALVSGINILPFVHDVVEKFDVQDLVRKVESIADGSQVSVRASVSNLDTIFNYWRERVFRESKGKQGLTPVEQVDVFLKCLFVPDDVYPHPNPAKRGILMVPGYGERVMVNMDHYKSFFEHFQQGYKPSEIKAFMAMKDRMIEDDTRRRQGAFFTPALWVDEAHREIERVLGPRWRQECIVWDPAAGTGNLTRDYHDWGQLISSTLEESDAESMKEHRWGGTVFQYDFLNPEVEGLFDRDRVNTIPPRVERMLREAAAAGKRLVFFMNPPYGTATVQSEESRAGIAITAVNAMMKDAKLGAPSQQLYAQFMFQAVELAKRYGFRDHTVALFSKPTFISSGSYKPFRDWWYAQHAYRGGFLFQASHFADVSGAWGVSFTVWSSGGRTDPKKFLPIRLTDVIDFAVATTAIKEIYNADGREASEWVRAPIKGLKGVDAPQMKSGLVLANSGVGTRGDLGFWANNSNSLQYSSQLVFLLSSAYSQGLRNGGGPLYPSNWRRAVALYGARKLVGGNWVNDKDEYLAPDESVPGYDQWVNDCHVYALLHNANNATAMRDVEYKGKPWRIKNHWFWRTRASCMDALDGRETVDLWRDCSREPTSRTDKPWEANGDAYFAYLLSTGQLTLSRDARRVLDLLDALWLRSLPVREGYYSARPVTDKEPDLHLNAWDAGIYQLKHLFRDQYPDDWKELMAAHKALSGRLRDGVYTYGFLRR